MPSEPDLWRCETCGQTFVSRNMPHSCAVVDLDSHFEAAPGMRAVFDAYLSAAELNGPVTVNATKSRITFQTRMRFAAVERPRRTHLNVHFVLLRAVESERLRVEFIPPRHYVHRLVLRAPEDVDPEVRSWLAEAYAVGDQKQLPG
ncbi:DUF5655 domain-containing protein [Solirubrobacter soli]|uniref:DUF5655 domain-containing protein n=1 Tax=Solirubrobacter soli TaxID=363832 RepID=UPI0004078A3A|nr:DUF5655 domain-containing protein [Solirubrobacter soli]